VILCAGAVNSPALLELSGVGQGNRLKALGVDVLRHLPGVGENLQDHFGAGVTHRVIGAGGLNQEFQGLRLLGHALRYLITRRGLLSVSPHQVTGYGRVSQDSLSADIQLWAIPATFAAPRRRSTKVAFERAPGLTLSFYQCRPESRGSTHISGAAPGRPPSIVGNYLEARKDREVFVAGLRYCRRILSQPKLAEILGAELTPGRTESIDEDLLAFGRKVGGSTFHIVGTCKMGADETAVVDDKLRVHGVAGLRVIDSAVMPNIVSANTHAATVMIAEKGADLLIAAARGRS
jgi:choline dehydrogenase